MRGGAEARGGAREVEPMVDHQAMLRKHRACGGRHLGFQETLGMREGGQPCKKRMEHGKVGGVSCKKSRKKERQEAQLSIPCKDLTSLNLAPLSSRCAPGSQV